MSTYNYTLSQLCNHTRETAFQENYRPRLLLTLCEPASPEQAKGLSMLYVRGTFGVRFYPVSDNNLIWWTHNKGNIYPISQEIENVLDHANYFITEISVIPGVKIKD